MVQNNICCSTFGKCFFFQISAVQFRGGKASYFHMSKFGNGFGKNNIKNLEVIFSQNHLYDFWPLAKTIKHLHGN